MAGVCNPSFWDAGLWGWLEDGALVARHLVGCQWPHYLWCQFGIWHHKWRKRGEAFWLCKQLGLAPVWYRWTKDLFCVPGNMPKGVRIRAVLNKNVIFYLIGVYFEPTHTLYAYIVNGWLWSLIASFLLDFFHYNFKRSLGQKSYLVICPNKMRPKKLRDQGPNLTFTVLAKNIIWGNSLFSILIIASLW